MSTIKHCRNVQYRAEVTYNVPLLARQGSQVAVAGEPRVEGNLNRYARFNELTRGLRVPIKSKVHCNHHLFQTFRLSETYQKFYEFQVTVILYSANLEYC